MIVPRIVTVWCPDWPVVAAGVAPTVPAAVLHANRVIARSPAAAMAGVRSGQRRREAQGCCPELVVLDHDPARDARQFEAVIRAVAELSPRLDVIEPGWLCLAARGPSRYFGGDEALAARLTAIVTGVLDSLGLASAPVGVGVADGRVAATIAARRADVTIAARRAGSNAGVVVAPGESASYLAPLTVGWLRDVGDATPELVELFIRLGLRTLGDLAALPAGDVYARFGGAGLHVHRLAGGGDDRPPGTTDPPAEWRTERAFDEPVAHLETVVFVAKQLADELVATLAGEGRVCTRVVVIAETEHGERSERAWYRAVGLSAAAIVERVRWQLEGWVAQPGAAQRWDRVAAARARSGARRRWRPARSVGWPVAGRPRCAARRHPLDRAVRRAGGVRAGVARRAAPGRAVPVGAGGDRRPRGSGRPAGGG